MAASNVVKKSSNLDFVKCGICFSVIDTPKTLPCLHTFCLNCLANHAKKLVQKNPEKYTSSMSCPNCCKESLLPKGGVKDIETNHFVNKLKERYCLERKFHDTDGKPECFNCDLPHGEIVGACLHCNDFLCAHCLENHTNIKQRKHHNVVTLRELRTGKFTMSNVAEQKTCVVHIKDIMLFCDTCNRMMCDDCSSDHSESNHRVLKLKTAASDKNSKLQVLYKQVKHIPKTFEASITEDDKVLQDLEANIQSAIAKYERTFKTERDTSQSEFHHQLKKLELERKVKIKTHHDSLQCQNAHLQTVLKLTKLVTKIGSDYDVIALYPFLADALREAYRLNPIGIAKTSGKVEFIPNEQSISDVSSYGTLVTFEQWILDKAIATLDFNAGRGICVIANNMIVVTSLYGAIFSRIREPVQIFDFNGVCQRELRPEELGGDGFSQPWQLVSSKDGNKCYLTDGMYVKVFDNSEGQFEFLYRFCAYKPDGQMSHKAQSRLTGLAIDSNDNIYIGSESYISIHNDLGKYIGGFDIPGMRPYFLAILLNGHIIISDCGGSTSTVHVFDMNGSKLHTFEPPPGLIPGETFHPNGVCIVHDEVFVLHNYFERECAVYRYSFTGKFLGVVTTDLYEPYGIALKDDTHLLILENDCIKVFNLR